jgi:serine O-acetyltransferase
MKTMNVFQLIQSDFRKHRSYGGNFWSIIFFTQGFWAVFQYRIAHFIYTKISWQPFRFILLFFTLLWQKIIEIIAGISIPASATIGHSFYIGHFGGIIINANTQMGNNCNVSQGVTIGVSGTDENRGIPTIGDFVYIGANSVIAGNIILGSHVLIGACSLVNQSALEYSVLLGVPAVVVSNKGSKGYI